jgi:hypothetical protein
MVESRALMAAEVREALERVQAISLELSESWTPTRTSTLARGREARV